MTGGSPSNIRGTLGVSGGTANLFLLNPNGIIFGPNARLDVRGSFVATTANAIQFGTQGFFSSSDLNPPPLLTVNPSAFFFNQAAHGSIVNRSTAPSDAGVRGLQVGDGRSLLLLGGNVSLEGGRVNAFGGRVELGGVTGAGRVGLNVNGNDLHMRFPDGITRADVSLTNGARVDVSGEHSGTIQVWGRYVLLRDSSQIASFNQGANPGRNLSVDASESVELTGGGGVLITQTSGAGRAGDITINCRATAIFSPLSPKVKEMAATLPSMPTLSWLLMIVISWLFPTMVGAATLPSTLRLSSAWAMNPRILTLTQVLSMAIDV